MTNSAYKSVVFLYIVRVTSTALKASTWDEHYTPYNKVDKTLRFNVRTRPADFEKV